LLNLTRISVFLSPPPPRKKQYCVYYTCCIIRFSVHEEHKYNFIFFMNADFLIPVMYSSIHVTSHSFIQWRLFACLLRVRKKTIQSLQVIHSAVHCHCLNHFVTHSLFYSFEFPCHFYGNEKSYFCLLFRRTVTEWHNLTTTYLWVLKRRWRRE